VDDRRTARLLVEREVAARRAGPALIRAKLAAKGVAPGVADECLGALTHDWELDQARTAAQRWAAGIVRGCLAGRAHPSPARSGFSWMR